MLLRGRSLIKNVRFIRNFDKDVAEEALVLRKEIHEIIDEAESLGSEQRDEILLYEPKPLWILRDGEKDHRDGMSMRNYWQAQMWGIPNEMRPKLGFLQRGRLTLLNNLLDTIYDTDYTGMSGTQYTDELFKLKSEPMLRPRIPSFLNPQFGRCVLNYMLTQMRKLGTTRLIIYELSGHNGQTALAILDILEEEYPELYETCEYHMIDVLGIWMTHRDAHIKAHHFDHYFEHHISFFDWDVLVSDRVFFLMLEIASYLPQDRIDLRPKSRVEEMPLIYQSGIVERYQWDDRFHSDPNCSRLDEDLTVHKLLDDELILEFLKHVDHDGLFTQDRLQQHLYENISEKRNVPSHEKTFMDCNEDCWFTGPDRYRARLGFLNHRFWIPSSLVSVFHKLRDYFPRHNLVMLDQSGRHTYIQGISAPSYAQYAFGKIWDVDCINPLDTSFGTNEMRGNLQFDHVRKTYYGMMELPPEHPLHLSCRRLEDFFIKYGSDELRDSLTVPGISGDQPLHQFTGARLLCAEYGGNINDIQDSPLNAASYQLHGRHTAMKYMTRVFNMFGTGRYEDAPYSFAPLSDCETVNEQLVDPTPVLSAIGTDPTPAQLDVPTGYKVRIERQKQAAIDFRKAQNAPKLQDQTNSDQKEYLTVEGGVPIVEKIL